MKYTVLKIDKSIKDLDHARKLQEKSRVLTMQLEQSLYRIKYSMIKDFKGFLILRLNELAIECLKNLKYDYKNPKVIAKMRAKKLLERELIKIYSWLRFNTYDDLIWQVLKTQRKDREINLKKGEIE